MENKQWSCEQCKGYFSSQSCLNRHVKLHGVRKNEECDICGLSFGRKDSLHAHVKRKHSGNQYACKSDVMCTDCGEMYTRSLPKLSHKCNQAFSHHQLKLNCKAILKICTIPLGQTTQQHEGKKKFKCGKCEKSFLSQLPLQRHIEIHHLNRRFECHLCQKKYISRSELLNHVRKHNVANDTDRKKYNCGMCDKAFELKKSLAVHVQNVHSNTVYECNMCPKTYNFKRTLSFHMRKVHNVSVHWPKPFKCTICNTAFQREGHLATHMSVHTTENTYKCDQCDKVLKSSVTLRRHVLIVHKN